MAARWKTQGWRGSSGDSEEVMVTRWAGGDGHRDPLGGRGMERDGRLDAMATDNRGLAER